jgi:hypothetical protein
LQSNLLQSQGCQIYRLESDHGQLPARANLRLWSRLGELLGEVGADQGCSLSVCYKGEVRLDIEAEDGPREANLVVSSIHLDGEGYLEHPRATSRATLRMSKLGPFGEAPSRPKASKWLLSPTQLVREQILLLPRTCYFFALGAENTMEWLDMRIVNSADGTQLAHGAGRVSAGLQFCTAHETQPVQLEVRSEGSSGPGILLRSVVSVWSSTQSPQNP